MSDEEIVDGLRRHDKRAVQELYSLFFLAIEKLVLQHGNGNREDAEDLFANTVEVLYLHVTEPGFMLTGKLFSYFYTISHHKRLNYLRKNSRVESISFSQAEGLLDKSPDIADAMEEAERYALYREKFKLLKEPCRRLLDMVFRGAKMKTIALEMGYSSENYARQRKLKCRERLMHLIQSDSRFKELKF